MTTVEIIIVIIFSMLLLALVVAMRSWYQRIYREKFSPEEKARYEQTKKERAIKKAKVIAWFKNIKKKFKK